MNFRGLNFTNKKMLVAGIEPAASTSQMWQSTNDLHPETASDIITFFQVKEK